MQINRILFATFATVAISAKHLTVIWRGVTSLRPRRNMVGFHFFDLEVFAANRTNTFLLFVLTALGVSVKRTDLQVPFVHVKDIPINTFLIADIGVLNKCRNTLLHFLNIDMLRATIVR